MHSPRHSQHALCVVLFVAVGALVAGCATTTSPPPARAVSYGSAIASPLRTETDRRMDATRRPSEFLPFSQVQPGMRVLDIAAGGGYTSQLLAIAIGPTGMLWAQAQKPGPN